MGVVSRRWVWLVGVGGIYGWARARARARSMEHLAHPYL